MQPRAPSPPGALLAPSLQPVRREREQAPGGHVAVRLPSADGSTPTS